MLTTFSSAILIPLMVFAVPGRLDTGDEGGSVGAGSGKQPATTATAPQTLYAPPWADGYESMLDLSLSRRLRRILPDLWPTESDEAARCNAMLAEYDSEVDKLLEQCKSLEGHWSEAGSRQKIESGHEGLPILAQRETEFATIADRQFTLDSELISRIDAIADRSQPSRWLRIRFDLDCQYRPRYSTPYWSSAPRLDLLVEEELDRHADGVTDADEMRSAIDAYRRTVLASWRDIRAYNVFLARHFWRLNAESARAVAVRGANATSEPTGPSGRRSQELRKLCFRAANELERANQRLLREAQLRLRDDGYERVTKGFWTAAGEAAGIDWWPSTAELFKRDALAVIPADDSRHQAIGELFRAGYAAAHARFMAACAEDKLDRLSSLGPDPVADSQVDRDRVRGDLVKDLERHLVKLTADVRALLSSEEWDLIKSHMQPAP